MISGRNGGAAGKEEGGHGAAGAIHASWSSYASRWTVRPVLWAAVVTAVIYVLLPCLEMVATPRERGMRVVPVDTAPYRPPAPLPAPRRSESAVEVPARGLPVPRLPEPPTRLPVRPLPMNLGMAMTDVKGDFALAFPVEVPDMASRADGLVFEISDLDEPPKPWVRLEPVYPAAARLHRIEGGVVLEFVVGADGATSRIQVISAEPGNVFVASAVRAAERWRFEPGRKDGQAVPTRVRQRITFRLE